MGTIPFFLFFLVRAITIALYFVIPLGAGLLNMFIDTVDGNILFEYGLPMNYYQYYDKVLDLVSYVVMFVVCLKTPIRKYITFAFIYRLIGQIIFFISGIRWVFLVFPNFVELPFITYFFFKRIGKESAFLKYQIPIYIFLGLNKLWMEYSVHIQYFSWTDYWLQLFGLK